MEDLLDDPSYSSPTFSTDHNASTISNLDNDSDPPDAMGGEHRSSLDMDDLERASDDGSIPSEDEKQAAADDMIMAERTFTSTIWRERGRQWIRSGPWWLRG